MPLHTFGDEFYRYHCLCGLDTYDYARYVMHDCAWHKAERPGNLASAMLKRHGVPKTEEITYNAPWQVWEIAQNAYYGGRFETTAAGPINGQVWQYDINSAYDARRVAHTLSAYGGVTMPLHTFGDEFYRYHCLCGLDTYDYARYVMHDCAWHKAERLDDKLSPEGKSLILWVMGFYIFLMFAVLAVAWYVDL